MEVSKVTREDAIACAHLLNAIRAATFDGIKGADLEAFANAKRWLHGIATQMAGALKSVPTPSAPTSPMTIKSMGPIGSPSGKKRKKK